MVITNASLCLLSRVPFFQPNVIDVSGQTTRETELKSDDDDEVLLRSLWVVLTLAVGGAF